MRPAALALALGLAVAWTAGPAWGQGRPQWRKTVFDHLQSGDCRRVKEQLDADLRSPSPQDLLFAGWLSQWGFCLERNADHAWAFYERADAAGESTAALHLAGLAATRAGGADVAAVLWWARRFKGKSPVVLRDCDPFPGRDDVTDTAFVESLKSWPQDRLMRCRNDVGFRSLVLSELVYPIEGVRLQMTGEVVLRYELERATVSVERPGRPGGAEPDELTRSVRDVAQRAMREMPPSPVPLEGQINISFVLE